MLGLFFQVLLFFKMFFVFTLFSYVYKLLYNKCNEKKVLKLKDKNKKVIKSKICLSFFYLFLVSSLYYCISWYVLFTMSLMFLLFSFVLMQNFNPMVFDVLKKYDSLPTVKTIWHYYSLFMNLLFKFMNPFYKFLDNKLNKFVAMSQTFLFNLMMKKNDDPINLLLNSNSLENDMKNYNHLFENINKFNDNLNKEEYKNNLENDKDASNTEK